MLEKKEKTVCELEQSLGHLEREYKRFVDVCVSLALWYNCMKFILLSVDVEVYLCENLSWEKKIVIIALFDNL